MKRIIFLLTVLLFSHSVFALHFMGSLGQTSFQTNGNIKSSALSGFSSSIGVGHTFFKIAKWDFTVEPSLNYKSGQVAQTSPVMETIDISILTAKLPIYTKYQLTPNINLIAGAWIGTLFYADAPFTIYQTDDTSWTMLQTGYSIGASYTIDKITFQLSTTNQSTNYFDGDNQLTSTPTIEFSTQLSI